MCHHIVSVPRVENLPPIPNLYGNTCAKHLQEAFRGGREMYIYAQEEKGRPGTAAMPCSARPSPADPLAAFYAAHDGKVSDKWQSYLPVYSEVFRPCRDNPVRILEIGVQNGGSLEIWRQFFRQAELIVGCDTNPRCAALTYDDPTIQVVIGDANDASVMSKIAVLSDTFDIIIDDGSHLSSDIVKSFALYFPKLAPGGLYVAEDLHCSYWTQFKGGLQAPYSSLSFFKRLSDMVNIEHWGADLPPNGPLGYFAETYGVAFDPSALARIEAVSFYNSICTVRKARDSSNTIGPRIVVGQIALVDEGPIAQNGATCPVMDEAANPWGPSAPPAERLTAEAPERAAREARIAAALPELRSGLAHPWRNLINFLCHHASRALSSVPFLSRRTRARMSRLSARYDPFRFKDLL